jgi:apolipoprotein N-acyltransferase
MCGSEFNLTHMAHKAGKEFKTIIDKYPSAELIVMPESSYYCRHLSKNPDLANLWSQKHMGKKVHLVIGAFRWENGKHYNSLHWIYDGKVQAYFDKRHTMVLVEQMPAWFDIGPLRSLYFRTFPEITPSHQPRPLLTIFDDTPFVPYICSELFFNEKPDDSYTGVPILAISNDSWFAYPRSVPYMQELMYLAARFKAIEWQRDIVYVAFSRSGYIDMYGNAIRAR